MRSYAELIERVPLLVDLGQELMVVQTTVVMNRNDMCSASPDGMSIELEDGREPGQGRAVLVPVRGEISAGSPKIVWEQSDEGVIIDSYFLNNGVKGFFAVRVRGDSMVGDGIFEGDILFVRKTEEARPGDIALVALDNAATCKRYYPEGDTIRLQPSNPSMPPILIKKSDFRSAMILGVVSNVHRPYSVVLGSGKKGIR